MRLLYNINMKKFRRIPVTQQGYEKLQFELEKLKKERPEAVKTLADARGMGDLSENGLYTAAKARLRSIDNQIFRLDIQIKLADVSEAKSSDRVVIGSKVTVENNSSQLIFSIVGDYEADPASKKISQHSPLGKVLMGKKVGDIAILNAPKGEVAYKVIKID